MNIKNATIVSTLHHILQDLRVRHIGGDLFLESAMPPIMGKEPAGPTFLLFDVERHFAISLQESTEISTSFYKPSSVLFSPIIFKETNGQDYARNPKLLRMTHNEYREMSLLIAYWFLRAKSGMGKEQTMQFLHTTYGDIAPVVWSNLQEVMDDMERFFRDLKEPLAA
jgi:hypothetical protein